MTDPQSPLDRIVKSWLSTFIAIWPFVCVSLLCVIICVRPAKQKGKTDQKMCVDTHVQSGNCSLCLTNNFHNFRSFPNPTMNPCFCRLKIWPLMQTVFPGNSCSYQNCDSNLLSQHQAWVCSALGWIWFFTGTISYSQYMYITFIMMKYYKLRNRVGEL